MKYIPFIILIILIVAFIRKGATFHPKPGAPAAPAAGTIIGCAPPEAQPVADNNGKFITSLPGLGKHVYMITTRTTDMIEDAALSVSSTADPPRRPSPRQGTAPASCRADSDKTDADARARSGHLPRCLRHATP